MNRQQATELLLSFFDPLAAALTSREKERTLLASVGFVLPDDVSFLGGTRDVIVGLVNIALDLEDLPDGASEIEVLGLFIEALGAVRAAAVQIDKLSSSLGPAATASPFVTDTDVLQVLPRRLLDLLTASFFARRFRTTHAMLVLVGVVEYLPRTFENDIHRKSFVEAILHWERLPRVVSGPFDLLAEIYGWGSADGLDATRLFRNMRALGVCFGLRAEFDTVDARAKEAFDLALDGAGSVPAGDDARVLRVPLLPIAQAPTGVEIHAVADPAGHVDGFGLGFYVEPQIETTFELTDTLRAELSFAGHVDGFGLIFRRGAAPTVLSAIFTDSATTVLENTSLDARVTFVFAQPDGGSLALLGSATGSHFEAGAIRAGIGISKPAAVAPEIIIEAAVEHGAIVVRAGEGDGFLSSVLGEGFTVPFDILLGVSTKRGFFVSGGAGLILMVPISRSLGPLLVDSVEIAIAVGDAGVRLSVAVTGGLEIGPIAAVVQGIGIEAKVDTESRGTLGAADLAIGFKPPTGIALKIEAGPVKGGGFLSLEPTIGQYAGALQLSVKGIGLTAVGVVNTILPDGREGYSFLIIITAEFPPIPLPFGFTLNGVGGLIGIHRRMDSVALRNKVSEGALESILFAPDPVKNINAVIANLRTIFPVQEGRYVFGPMVKLSWGPSTLLTMELAVILDIPSPLRLAIVGRMRLVLPTPEHALADIKLEVVGLLDFDRQEATITASLVDSYLVGFALTGDMALILGWGATKSFALTIGGFFPGFPIPEGLPPRINRLGIALSSGNNPRLRFEAYFAVTSNTVQFGALADLYAAADIFGSTFAVVGQASFDAFLQLDPFRFIVQLHALLGLMRNGTPLLKVELAAKLSGPKPWHAAGFAELTIIFTVHIGFEITVGEAEEEPPKFANVKQLLLDEVARPESWASLPPAEAGAIVTLKDATPSDGVVLHPLGGVTLLQRLVPFEKTINRYGAAHPEGGPVRFKLESLAVVGTTGTLKPDEAHFAPAFADFAPGQFDDLTEDEKLHRPAFEAMQAGGSATIIALLRSTIEKVLGDDYTDQVLYEAAPAQPNQMKGSGQSFVAEGVRDEGLAQADPGISMKPERYVVAHAETLEMAPDGAIASAAQAYDQLAKIPPGERRKYVVVPANDASKAA